MREGLDPTDPTSSSNLAVGEDDEEQDGGASDNEDSDQTRRWSERDGQDKGKNPAKSNTHYGTLDDRHVWNARGEDTT